MAKILFLRYEQQQKNYEKSKIYHHTIVNNNNLYDTL